MKYVHHAMSHQQENTNSMLDAPAALAATALQTSASAALAALTVLWHEELI